MVQFKCYLSCGLYVLTAWTSSEQLALARALQAELAQYDGPTLGAELLERLADTGTSVHRVAPAAAG